MSALGAYGAWVVVDFRLALFVFSLSVGLALLVMGISGRRNRKWHENVTLFAALFFAFGFVAVLLLQTVFGYPVFVVRDFFPIE